jgi:8-oxo-dGTP pyrophosphatase MutT (NUDIX family)
MAHLDLAGGKMKNVRGIIWRDAESERRFLITQELSGKFTVPGGCKDAEDADLEAALRRELNEEVGLKPEDYTMSRVEESREYEDLYHHHPESERYGKNTIIYPFLVHLNALVPLTLQASEIKDAVWLDADAARRALAYAPHMKETFEIGLRALNG